MDWMQTLLIAAASPLVTAAALLWQQHRTSLREDRIREEDRAERARDREQAAREAQAQRTRDLSERWRDERLRSHSTLLDRLNTEMQTLGGNVDAVVGSSDVATVDITVLPDEHDHASGEALARVQVVGSVHSAHAAERAYTQALLARLAVTDAVERHPGRVPEEDARALDTERRLLFDAIADYRDAARADLEVD